MIRYGEINKANIGEALKDHVKAKWEDAQKQPKPMIWWVEDFMAAYGVWWGDDFQKDVQKVVRTIPAAITDIDDLCAFLVKTIGPKMGKPEKEKKLSIKQIADEATAKYGATLKKLVDIPAEAQKIINSASSKTHAMYLLDKEGYERDKIAEYMNTNPGLVGNGITMYKKKLKKSL